MGPLYTLYDLASSGGNSSLGRRQGRWGAGNKPLGRRAAGAQGSQWHTSQPQSPGQLAAISWLRPIPRLINAGRPTENAPVLPPVHGGRTTAPRPYIGYVSSQWHTRQPQAPQQLAATSWCRSHACRATERAVSMPRSTEGKKPRKTPESSTLRWEIGYGSGYGHIRQPQAADEPAATSYCLQHHRQPLDSLVSSCSWMPWACSRLLLQGGNRVLRGRI